MRERLTTLNCLALALSSCCSMASACCVLCISSVAPMGDVEEGAGGGLEERNQPSRESLSWPSMAGSRNVLSRLQWTAAPTTRLTRLVTRVLGELSPTCSHTR